MTLVMELMTPHPHLINPESTLREAANHMREFDCGSLVVGLDKPQGIITDRDIVIYGLAAGKSPDEASVGDIMTAGVISCYEDEKLENAASLMSEQDIRRLVVLNRSERTVGVLSIADIIKSADNGTINDEVMHRLFKYA